MFNDRGHSPEPVSFRMQDGQTILLPRTGMRRMYSRFSAQSIDAPAPGSIRIRATLVARLFCAFFGLTGLTLLVGKFVVGFPWPAIAGGALLLTIGGMGYAAWSREMTLRVMRETGTAVLHQGGFIGRGYDRSYALSDIACIQLLRVVIEGEFTVTVYEVNLVLAAPAGERIWLYANHSPNTARTAAEQFAATLEVEMLDNT